MSEWFIVLINQIFKICFHLFQTCTTCLQEEIRLFENIYLQFQCFIFIISFSFFFIGQVFLNFLEHVRKKPLDHNTGARCVRKKKKKKKILYNTTRGRTHLLPFF
jgi:hypothetical protein